MHDVKQALGYWTTGVLVSLKKRKQKEQYVELVSIY
jgi:hypothetical protein